MCWASLAFPANSIKKKKKEKKTEISILCKVPVLFKWITYLSCLENKSRRPSLSLSALRQIFFTKRADKTNRIRPIPVHPQFIILGLLPHLAALDILCRGRKSPKMVSVSSSWRNGGKSTLDSPKNTRKRTEEANLG